jgi:hypothetical protein
MGIKKRFILSVKRLSIWLAVGASRGLYLARQARYKGSDAHQQVHLKGRGYDRI